MLALPFRVNCYLNLHHQTCIISLYIILFHTGKYYFLALGCVDLADIFTPFSKQGFCSIIKFIDIATYSIPPIALDSDNSLELVFNMDGEDRILSLR